MKKSVLGLKEKQNITISFHTFKLPAGT